MLDKAYVSIIEWSGLLDEPARIALLTRVLGMDGYHARQAVRRGVPQVILRTDVDKAEAALDAFHAVGVLAFAPTQSQLDERADFHAAKRLIAGSGATYLAEAWRGEPRTFDAARTFLLVRASLRSTEKKSIVDQGSAFAAAATATSGMPPIGHTDFEGDIASSIARSRTTLTEIIDLHQADGTRIRLNGDKFSFDVLGDARGYTDRDNMDKLAVRLSEQASRAIVDLDFRQFRCPPGILRTYYQSALGRVRRTVEAPAFDFYSVWVALMYRRMSRG